jgi:hypothetical protein
VQPELLFDDRLLSAQIERVFRPDLGALSAPALCGFRLRYIIRDGEHPHRFVIQFRTTTEQTSVENPGLDLFHRSLSAWRATEQAFFRLLPPSSAAFGPAPQSSNSGLAREAASLGEESSRILDTQGGENVDVVGDAHSNQDNWILPIRFLYSNIYYGPGK